MIFEGWSGIVVITLKSTFPLARSSTAILLTKIHQAIRLVATSTTHGSMTGVGGCRARAILFSSVSTICLGISSVFGRSR